MSLALMAPQALTLAHCCTDFSCGEPVLAEWLKRRAMDNQVSGTSHTFVVADQAQGVQGYYAMAVDRRAQGVKLGGSLLQDAFHRALTVAQHTGVRALLVHALHPRAKLFYEHYGFQASPTDPLILMLCLTSPARP